MKVIKLKESDLVNTIKNILNEQSGGSMIPENGYQAISDIESVYSYTNPSTGKITGQSLTGKEREGNIKNYVNSTIGLDNWFKINELFRTQLYAYMYQTDSGEGGMRMWWIAGLAQAINPKINRASISKKPLDDENVKQAIDLIKKACQDDTINSYYTKWLFVVDNQYSLTGSAHKDNYKNVWKNRPKAIERLMKGEDWNVVKKEFNSKTTTKQQPTAPTKQQPAAAPKQQTQVQGGQDIASIIELSENASTSLRLKSPLAAGKYFEFMIQNETFGCTWRNTINAPYSDDNMRLQVSNKGGKLTLMIVTGDGKKVEMRADGTSCKKV